MNTKCQITTILLVTFLLMGCSEKEQTPYELVQNAPQPASAASYTFNPEFLYEVAERAGKTVTPEEITRRWQNGSERVIRVNTGNVSVSYQLGTHNLLAFSASETGSKLHQDLQNGNVGEPLSQSEFESRAIEFFERVFRKVPDDKWQLDPTTVDNPESIKQGMKTLRWYYYAHGYKVRSGMTCNVSLRADTGEVISASFHDLHPIEDPVINYSQEYARNLAIQELKKRYSVVNETAPVRTNYRALRREPDEPYKPLILCHTVSLKTDTHMVYDVDISARTGEVIEKLGFKVLPNR